MDDDSKSPTAEGLIKLKGPQMANIQSACLPPADARAERMEGGEGVEVTANAFLFTSAPRAPLVDSHAHARLIVLHIACLIVLYAARLIVL